MDPAEGVPKVPLNKFPVEIIQDVARHLDDKSLLNLMLACREVYAAIQDRDAGFWRIIWFDNFDAPGKKLSNKALKISYQRRKKALRRTVITRDRDGAISWELKTAQVVRDVALDAKPIVDEDGKPSSLNFLALKKFVQNKDEFIGYIFKPGFIGTQHPREVLIAQMLIAPLGFDPDVKQSVFGSGDSQIQAYLAPCQQQVFVGITKEHVNLQWLLHIMNLFRAHMMCRDMVTLFDAYHLLKDSERPGFWTKQIQYKEKFVLAKVWKGTFAYFHLHEILPLRERYQRSQVGNQRNRGNTQPPMTDRNLDEMRNVIHTVKFFRPDKHTEETPPHWDNLLNGHWTHRQGTSRKPTARLPFEGVGFDTSKFYITGWVYPLPPQDGVPGWYRVAMMKTYVPKDKVDDYDRLFAYEGVITPGGQMMVGRWWDPETAHDGMYCLSGPFIYWNVDLSVPEDLRGPETGVDINGIPGVQDATIAAGLQGDGAGYNAGMDFLQNAFDFILSCNRGNGVEIIDTEVQHPTDLLFVDISNITASSASAAYTAALNAPLPSADLESDDAESDTEGP